MESIPAWFWMVIITGLSGMLGLIFFYVAMLMRETTMTVREFRYMLVEFHDIIDSSRVAIDRINHIIGTISTTVETISSTLLRPLSVFTTLFAGLRGFASRFGMGEDSNEIENDFEDLE